mmetsp:Transcript_16306/g.48959  ORF Transcript_16306/g.48959 Transcript_16306/m.48959 type:complete len:334 (-) Transcript_16306:30-1031(-)
MLRTICSNLTVRSALAHVAHGHSTASVLTRQYSRVSSSALPLLNHLSIAPVSSPHPHSASMVLSGQPHQQLVGAQPSRSFITLISDYERGVTFTLGKLTSVKEGGLRIYVPPIQQMFIVDMRTRVYELPPQDIMTRDNVGAKVTAVAYFRVCNAEASVLEVANVHDAVQQLMQTQLRDVLCQQEFNEILEQRDRLSQRIRDEVAHAADRWGVVIERVQMKNIDLVDPNMVRAMAKEAEASRERTAAIIRADGELQASQKLAEAAEVLQRQPAAMQLRRLQTLEKISKEKSQHTVVVPMDLSSAQLGLQAAGVRLPDRVLLDEHEHDISRMDQV